MMGNNIELDILLSEFNNVSQSIRSLMSSTEKIIAIGFTILVTGLGLGLKEDILEIFFLIPIAVLAMLFYAISIYTAVLLFGGYKKHLEESINKILGKNILIWEDLIRKLFHRSLPVTVLYFIYLIFFVFSTIVAFHELCINGKISIILIFIFVILFLFILLIVSFMKMLKIFEKSYKQAKEEYSKKIN